MNWHILTGEYPPRPGGVADYSAIVAAGLARTGRLVRVWTIDDQGDSAQSQDEPRRDEASADSGVIVARLNGRWSPDDLRKLETELDRTPAPRLLSIQYTPNAWGYKGLNFGFARFVKRRAAAGDLVVPTIHEAFYPFDRRDKPTRWALAAAQRIMMREILNVSHRVYIVIPRWDRYLRTCFPRRGLRTFWLPIVSNVPYVDDPAAVSATRATIAAAGEPIVGCFSTFGEPVTRTLGPLLRGLPGLVPDAIFMLMGRGSQEYREQWIKDDPSIAPRVCATGGLSGNELSLHLQACDVTVQAYPDGLSTRRGTIMAALANGCAIVANPGWLTEPFWSDIEGVRIVAAADPKLYAEAIGGLLSDDEGRRRLGVAAKRLYDDRFAVDKLTATMIADAGVGKENNLN